MRMLPLRVAAYVLVLAAPGLAQSVTVDDLPQVELSVGVQAMAGGPGADVEAELRRLGFASPDSFGHQTPRTNGAGLIPGAFAAGHVALARHIMIGLLVGVVENETEGLHSTPSRGYSSLVTTERVTTTGLVFSYRPNRWLKFGAGPAVHDRLFFFGDGRSRQATAEATTLGWMTDAEAKFTHRADTPGRAPAFGYAIAQYRRTGSMASGSAVVRILDTNADAVTWPETRLHFDHWVIGFGVGLEF